MKRKKKEHHDLPYYEEILDSIHDPGKIMDLLDDAASQPKKYISTKDFEKLFWLAQDKMRGEYA